ncbi:uncharacterized protein L201_006039 [Kwoniella dendrophila CBS 6074]|uniref:B-related factor 1 n=1 Tax=Kwoniella dendrophila CBS 6074 TaxID=1295534 RepID=A0AAX4K1Y5_9TREE
MSSSKICRICGPNPPLDTDYSRGTITCQSCGTILEEGILVSEVGFAEGSGGRVHIQGAFVGRNQTGFAGVRSGVKGIQNTEGIKQAGADKIESVARQMHISAPIYQKAKRFFSMAVDNRFNKGRRTEYIVASCLYLACRLSKDAMMLIDFSERLSINVYELGATYLKLRSILHLPEQMPEVDPAIYNLRFAYKLDFPSNVVHSIATDASRLVKRFRSDWMTQGRRPAGVCGACLIIAARMSNYLRTPDEVSQIVKVHTSTIKKRLLEFAKTEMAKKTVAEWRNLSNDELDKLNPVEKPPVVKQNELKQIKIEQLKNKAKLEAGSDDDEQEKADESDEEEEEDDDDELDGDTAGNQEGPRKRRKKGKEKAIAEEDEMSGVVKAAAKDVANDEDQENDDGAEEEEEDDNMEPITQAEYVRELEAARDNPEESKAERLREKSAFMKQVKNYQKNGNADGEDFFEDDEDNDENKEEFEEDEEGLDDLVENLEEYENENEDEDEDKEEEEEEEEEEEPATQLRTITQEERELGNNKDNNKKQIKKKEKKEEFNEWNDESATIQFLSKELFKNEELLYKGKELINRIKMWIGERDPKTLYEETMIIQKARLNREKLSKLKESNFDDLNDEELEFSFKLTEDEKQARARMWLSTNGKWLEDEKVRLEQRAIAMRAKGLDPSKPKPKRKRAAPHKGPYNSSRDAIQNFTKGKQFSSRINYDILRGLDLSDQKHDLPGSGSSGLMTMNDDKDDDDKEDDEYGAWDEKGDEW